MYNPKTDGFTQSLLTTYLKCPAKARASLNMLYKPGFSKALMFGSMFHEFLDVMLNEYKDGKFIGYTQVFEPSYMNTIIDKVNDNFSDEYVNAPADGKSIMDESSLLCAVVVPRYFEYWKEDFFGDNKKTWIEIEGEFKVPVSGGLFRGKRDGVFSSVIDGDPTPYLFETKTKSRFDDATLISIIPRDFQVLSYMLAYYLEHKVHLRGVLYNVIRKPQLRKSVKENWIEFCRRIDEDIKKRGDFYFSRYHIDISQEKIEKFSRKFAKLTLDFAEWSMGEPDEDRQHTHNCVDIYGNCPFMDYCSSDKQNKLGLEVKEKLFRELS